MLIPFVHPDKCPLYKELREIAAKPTPEGVKRARELTRLIAERSAKRTAHNLAETERKT